MKKDILNLENKKIKDIDIADSVWGIKVFPDIIHQYIRYQNAKSSGEKLEKKGLMFFLSFFLCDLQDFKF